MRALILSLWMSSTAFAATPDSLRTLEGASDYPSALATELATADVAQLRGLAEHEDARVARTARVLLAHVEHPELAAFVADVQPMVKARNGAPRFIDDGFSEQGMGPLIVERVLHGNDAPDVQVALLGRLLGQDGWQRELTAAFDDLPPRVRAAAVQFAARDRDGGCAGIIEQAVSDADPSVRVAALRASASVPGVSVDRLLPALTDQDAAVRAQAAWSVGVVGATVHAEQLRPLLTDSSSDVRLKALSAIERLGAEVPAHQLEILGGDEDSRVRARVERLRSR